MRNLYGGRVPAMQFSLYRRANGHILAVPSVFVPGEFLEEDVHPELFASVRIPPDEVDHDLLVEIGLHGYAVLTGTDLEQFEAALVGIGKISPAGAEASD